MIRFVQALLLVTFWVAAIGCSTPMLIQHPHAGHDHHDGRELALRYGRVPASGSPEPVQRARSPLPVGAEPEAELAIEILRFRVPLRARNDTPEPWRIRRSAFSFRPENGTSGLSAAIPGQHDDASDVLVVVQPEGSATFDLIVQVEQLRGDGDPRGSYRLVFWDGEHVVMTRLFTVRRFTEASQLLRVIALATGLVVLAGL